MQFVKPDVRTICYGIAMSMGALLLAGSLSGSALAWRAALRECGAPCGRVDAVARYGVGSIANAVRRVSTGMVPVPGVIASVRSTVV